MEKYLLIILILLFNIKIKVCSQIITITQSGRKIISIPKPIKHKIVITTRIVKNESEPLIRQQKKIDFERQPEVKQREFLAPPLKGKLHVTSYCEIIDFGSCYSRVGKGISAQSSHKTVLETSNLTRLFSLQRKKNFTSN